MHFMDKITWDLIILACLTLGLAPYAPPHIWEKLQMLSQGKLVRPIDWFDFFFHGIPWIALVLKIVATLVKKN